MRYGLPDHLSFCRVDDRLIFLDIARDRYFQLPPTIEHSFLYCLDRADPANVDIAGLLERNILVGALAASEPARTQPTRMPTRSAVECAQSHRTLQMAATFEVLSIVLLTRWQLKNRALKEILDSLGLSRPYTRPPQSPEVNESPNVLSIDAASTFAHARRYVPAKPTCLIDSIALARFLSRRHLSGSLVFGVTGAPFSAHCWVQVEDTVLNDTVGNVGAYTPIRVIRWPADTSR